MTSDDISDHRSTRGDFDAPHTTGPTDAPPARETPDIQPARGTPDMPPARGTPGMPPARGTPDMPPARGTPDMPPARGTPDMPPARGNAGVPPARGNADLRADLADKVRDAIATVAKGQDRYALLDYPSHWNIGDSAIWQGEIAALHHVHRRAPDHVSHIRYPVEQIARTLPEDGMLYLNGGGNFGDLWPQYQNYREAVIERYRDRRIVQLPQSLHYGDAAGIERTRRVIGGHPDFHMMVRDRPSLDFVREHFDCNVMLVPDAAFCIDMAGFDRAPRPEGIGCIFRDDKERRPDAEAGQALFGAAAQEDWRQQGAWARNSERGLAGLGAVAPPRLARGVLGRSFNATTRARVALGLAQIDRHAVLVTDRLHGHIMATLLGKPHVVIDNFYGKISNFIAAFGADDITLCATDYPEAHAMARELAARHGAAAA